MSGLAAVLARRRAPGIYRWSSGLSVADVRHAVEHAGWRFVGLDTWRVEDRRGFLAACAEAFDFPSWFGHNFDALADSLRDVRAEEAHGVVVLWDGWGPLGRADQRALEAAIEVFAERSGSRRADLFVVLLRGPGPDIDVPELDPHRK